MEKFELQFEPESMSGFSFPCPADFNMAHTDSVMRLMKERADFSWIGFEKGARPPRIWVMCRATMVDTLKKVAQEAMDYVIINKHNEEVIKRTNPRGPNIGV